MHVNFSPTRFILHTFENPRINTSPAGRLQLSVIAQPSKMIHPFKKAILLFILFNFQFLISNAQNVSAVFQTPSSQHWADSVLKTLSYEEKIGQLFMPATRPDSLASPDTVAEWISKYHIGGLMFLKGQPYTQAQLTNYYQSQSKIPLLISIDGEWGLNMRLDSTIRFPRQMTLGAMKNDALIYDMGAEIARQCKRMGIHINFAPDIDINNNAANPVINSRSFGEDKNDVARKGLLYMKGLQDNGILACGKHFPGHGNTDTDSHLSLPVINQSLEEIDSIELFPFRHLITNGLGSIMVAHLFIPALDTTSAQPSTLSKTIITNLLKEKLNFNGLIFTDALNMKGVSDFYQPGALEIKALQAGNDMLLFSLDIAHSFEQVHYAIQNCDLNQKDIDEKVKKILEAKYWAGLYNYKPVDLNNLHKDLNSVSAEWLNYRLYHDAITVLKNNNEIIPIRNLTDKKFASVVINDSINNLFQQALSKYAPVDEYRMVNKITDNDLIKLTDSLSRYDYVIASIHNTSTRSFLNFGISEQTNVLVKTLSAKTKLIVCLFGNSYSITRIPDVKNAQAFIISYEDTYFPQWITAQIIFGGIGTTASLPVSPSPDFMRGRGIVLNEEALRLKYTLPQEENFSVKTLSEIDSIVELAIDSGAIPGCQVLAAYNGKVIYEKAFGFKIYDSTEAVHTDDLYDIASVTKITATALAAMKLYEDGKLDLNKKISRYLPELKKTNKKDITLLDMLTHRSGLLAWIPFFKETVVNGKPLKNIYQNKASPEFPVKVADSLFIKKEYEKIIWQKIADSKLGEKGKYVYSDLGLLLMQKIIEKVSRKKFEVYLADNFYKPLGLHNLVFNPKEKNFHDERIVPTENDTIFRNRLIRGYVHDPAAAMLGGVAGNAGLFSNAGSLAVIMQMLMQGGEYGGTRFLKSETVDYFTMRQFPSTSNRRGIIFDKPETDTTANGPTGRNASTKTFGHTGFTGTCAWADPENKIIYVFLSNRIYPDAANNKLIGMNIRTKIMDIIYNAKKDLR
ncbi:MAG: glycoside hydrolase family 3 N-terminal domain-containing protein [Bacteroidia bacterium]